EHYRLLAAIVQVIEAKNVIEIGTSTGMGTLSISQALPSDGKLATFDVLPWRGFKNTWFAESDFSSDKISQHIADIGVPGVIGTYRDLFVNADFIFIDGPKDGVTEQNFINALGSIDLARNPIVMFDDIRLLNMVGTWRRLARPKLDLTSFG